MSSATRRGKKKQEQVWISSLPSGRLENSDVILDGENFNIAIKNYEVVYFDSQSILWEWKRGLESPQRTSNENEDVPFSGLINPGQKFVLDACEFEGGGMTQYRFQLNFSHIPAYSEKNQYTLEYKDVGSFFYRCNFMPIGDKHENWFGFGTDGKAVAISLARILLYRGRCDSGSTKEGWFSTNLRTNPALRFLEYDRRCASGDGKNHPPNDQLMIPSDFEFRRRCDDFDKLVGEPGVFPAWMVIIRREKGPDLRGCIIDRKNHCIPSPDGITTKAKRSSDGGRRFGFWGKLQRSFGVEKGESMDPRVCDLIEDVSGGHIHPEELSLGQPSTAIYERLARLDELEVIENHKFGVLLCKAGQSTEAEAYDNGEREKERITGIVHIKMAAQRLNLEEKVARKRHIGNTLVTFIFQEDDHLPFEADTILSQFQQVLIVVHPEENGQKYRVDVCRAVGVPPFGPPLPKDRLFDYGPELTNFLLTKAFNGSFAATKSEKFQVMMQRSRLDYLREFALDSTNFTEPGIRRKHVGRFSSFRSLSQRIGFLSSIPPIGANATGDQSAAQRMKSSFGFKHSSSEPPTNRTSRFGEEPPVQQADQSNLNTRLPADKTLNQEKKNRLTVGIIMNCFDFGRTYHITLISIQTLTGWKSAANLVLSALNRKPTNNEVAQYPKQMTDMQFYLTLSRNWLVISAFSAHLNHNILLLVVKTRGIFAYSVEDEGTTMVLYFSYGQSVRFRTDELPNSDYYKGGDVKTEILRIIQDATYPIQLRQTRHFTVRLNDSRNASVSKSREIIPLGTTDLGLPYPLPRRHGTTAGLRMTLADLGIHVSYTKRGASNYCPDFPRLPCVFKVDVSSPGYLAGLRRGQIILRIGSHALTDLFRAILCTTDRWTDVYCDPFMLGSPPVKSNPDLAPNLLNLIRQLHFSKNVSFTVCKEVEDDHVSARYHTFTFPSRSSLRTDDHNIYHSRWPDYYNPDTLQISSYDPDQMPHYASEKIPSKYSRTAHFPRRSQGEFRLSSEHHMPIRTASAPLKHVSIADIASVSENCLSHPATTLQPILKNSSPDEHRSSKLNIVPITDLRKHTLKREPETLDMVEKSEQHIDGYNEQLNGLDPVIIDYVPIRISSAEEHNSYLLEQFSCQKRVNFTNTEGGSPGRPILDNIAHERPYVKQIFDLDDTYRSKSQPPSLWKIDAYENRPVGTDYRQADEKMGPADLEIVRYKHSKLSNTGQRRSRPRSVHGHSFNSDSRKLSARSPTYSTGIKIFAADKRERNQAGLSRERGSESHFRRWNTLLVSAHHHPHRTFRSGIWRSQSSVEPWELSKMTMERLEGVYPEGKNYQARCFSSDTRDFLTKRGFTWEASYEPFEENYPDIYRSSSRHRSHRNKFYSSLPHPRREYPPSERPSSLELQRHVNALREQLDKERQKRSQMEDACAGLLQENRQLRRIHMDEPNSHSIKRHGKDRTSKAYAIMPAKPPGNLIKSARKGTVKIFSLYRSETEI
ncbi:unnamed protein product [Calicophoron daubneyi]|uniref:Rap-GAP domain-containing protein n=1 Tax=Calicophoron daubneyi TaxID=300641 RepID=A0AAV2TQZ3_CALDB